jgi:hypothetical protein
MSILTVAFAITAIYITAYCYKLYLYYAKCKYRESLGGYVEVCGVVLELHGAKRRKIKGATTTISFPRYVADYGGKKIDFISRVKRGWVNEGDTVVLMHYELDNVIWAKGDLPLLKRQIIGRLLVIFILLLVVFLVHLTTR